LIRGLRPPPHPFGARRCAPVQSAYRPSALLRSIRSTRSWRRADTSSRDTPTTSS
jgi:hypothetical protein